MEYLRKFREQRVKHSGTTRWCYLIVLPYYASMAAVAGLHLNDCPAEDMIPVVVLANGALTIVYCLAMFAQSRWPTNSALNCFGGLLHFAKFALTIVVAVYFFMNFPPKHLNDPDDFCHLPVYAFAGVTSFGLLLAPVLCVLAVVCTCAAGCLTGCLDCLRGGDDAGSTASTLETVQRNV